MDGGSQVAAPAVEEPAAASRARTLLLSMTEGVFITAVAMVIPARGPLVLRMTGDPRQAALTLARMTSTGAFLELFIGPILGGLSDRFGRKTVLMGNPSLLITLHAFVGFFPKLLWVNFIDRAITGGGIQYQVMAGNAMLSDLYSGAELAVQIAAKNAFYGLGMLAGPSLGGYIGARYDPRYSFLCSSMVGIKESITVRKKFSIATSVNPLRFTKLFSSLAMAKLSVTYALMDAAQFFNIYDFNFLFLNATIGWDGAQIGLFTSAWGACQFLSGKLAQRTIKSMGQRGHTYLSSLATAACFVGLGLTKAGGGAAYQLGASLVVGILMHQRNAVIGSALTSQALKAGMAGGDAAASISNLSCICKIGYPLANAMIYKTMTTNGNNVPGSPYFLISTLAVLSSLVFAVTKDSELNPK
jgi:DHA1 family tetracycline resistance protein-like MFS transporter